MKELSKAFFEIITAVRQARIEIGLHKLEPEDRNEVIDGMLHRAIIKTKELEATLSPRPIEEAPSGQRIDVWTHWEGDMVVTRWPDCYVVDGVLKGPHGPMSRPPSKASIIGWTPVPVVSLPLPSMDGGEK